MSHLERPGCTCRAAGDPAAYMHDEGCPSRDGVPVAVLTDSMRQLVRARRVADELVRLGAWGGARIGATPGDRCVRVVGPDDLWRKVDGLAALGLLIELPDGAGTQAAWAALLTLPELT